MPCPILGHLAALLKRNKRYVDYSSGYVGVFTPKPKEAPLPESKFTFSSSYQQKENRDFFHCALLPCDTFLTAFQQPKQFADLLQVRAQNVLVEWPVINHGLAPENRVMAERYFSMYQNVFRGARNNAEQSIYEMQISSYGYTKAARKVPIPEPLQMRDLKASVLLPNLRVLSKL